MGKTKPKYIITEYRLWNNSKKRLLNYSWSDPVSMKRHLAERAQVYYLHPVSNEWMTADEWFKLEGHKGRNFHNFPTKTELVSKTAIRLFGDDVEVLEVVVTDKLQSYVKRYNFIGFFRYHFPSEE